MMGSCATSAGATANACCGGLHANAGQVNAPGSGACEARSAGNTGVHAGHDTGGSSVSCSSPS